MSIGKLHGIDPWEAAKIVRQLGRQRAQLIHERERLMREANGLHEELSGLEPKYRAAVVALEAALLAGAPHERLDGAVMTATEMILRQTFRRTLAMLHEDAGRLLRDYPQQTQYMAVSREELATISDGLTCSVGYGWLWQGVYLCAPGSPNSVTDRGARMDPIEPGGSSPFPVNAVNIP